MLLCPNKPVVLFIQHQKQVQVKFFMQPVISCTEMYKPHCSDSKKKQILDTLLAFIYFYFILFSKFFNWNFSSLTSFSLPPFLYLCFVYHFPAYSSDIKKVHFTSFLARLDHTRRVVFIKAQFSNLYSGSGAIRRLSFS